MEVQYHIYTSNLKVFIYVALMRATHVMPCPPQNGFYISDIQTSAVDSNNLNDGDPMALIFSCI